MWLQKEYDHYFKIKEGTTTITQNSLVANHDIAIGFEGSNVGAVTLNGLNADVIVNGVIDSGFGVVNISGANIIQGNDGFINAQGLNFTNVRNVGIEVDSNGVKTLNHIITNAAEISGISTNNSDNTFAVKVIDNGTEIGEVSGFDTVSVSANKDIVQKADTVLTGKRVELESQGGNVRIDNLELDVSDYASATDKTQYGLKVSADDDISIKHQGDVLYLDSVISETGDIYLETTGSILDNNFTDTLDSDFSTRLSKYQNSGILDGSAATAQKQKNLLAIKVKSKYNNYQTLKDSVDENGVYVLDEDFMQLLQGEYGFSDAQVEEYIAKKQAKYDELKSLGVDQWTAEGVKTYISDLTSDDGTVIVSNQSIYARSTGR